VAQPLVARPLQGHHRRPGNTTRLLQAHVGEQLVKRCLGLVMRQVLEVGFGPSAAHQMTAPRLVRRPEFLA
jgi:hypothetical protein